MATKWSEDDERDQKYLALIDMSPLHNQLESDEDSDEDGDDILILFIFQEKICNKRRYGRTQFW